MLTVGKFDFSAPDLIHGIAVLFCSGKPAVKHEFWGPCYPCGMEIFPAVTLTASLIVLIVVSLQKQHGILCQQEVSSKHH
jgi:hypothetical protein